MEKQIKRIFELSQAFIELAKKDDLVPGSGKYYKGDILNSDRIYVHLANTLSFHTVDFGKVKIFADDISMPVNATSDMLDELIKDIETFLPVITEQINQNAKTAKENKIKRLQEELASLDA